MHIVKRVLVIVSVMFYLSACFNTAYQGVGEGGGNYLGIICLAFGWASFMMGFAPFFAWLANLPYLVNIVLVLITKKVWMRIATSMLSVVSFLLSFGAFGVSQVMKDEAGNMEYVTTGLGTYFWMISLFIMIVAAVLPGEKKPVEVNYINNPNPIK